MCVIKYLSYNHKASYNYVYYHVIVMIFGMGQVSGWRQMPYIQPGRAAGGPRILAGRRRG